MHNRTDRSSTVISSTDARQGSKKKMSYRVLTRSMLILAVVGAALLAFFFTMTPRDIAPTSPATTAPVSSPSSGAASGTTVVEPTTPPAATVTSPDQPAEAPAATPAPDEATPETTQPAR
ncbi:MAG: hypothetical protein ACRCS9_09265 [Hyphomicrobium sp.]